MIWDDEKEIMYDCYLYRKVVRKKNDIAATEIINRWLYTVDELLDAIVDFEDDIKNIDTGTLATDKNGKPLIEETSKLGRCWTLKTGEMYQEYIMGFVSLNQN